MSCRGLARVGEGVYLAARVREVREVRKELELDSAPIEVFIVASGPHADIISQKVSI